MSMCQHGDCTRDTKDGPNAVRITITHNHTGEKEGAGFCCMVHASLYLRDWLRRTRPSGEPLAELELP